MPALIIILLVSVAVVWLLRDQIVKYKLRNLKADLPVAYQVASEATDDETAAQSLILLSIDLMRKEHCTLSFAALSDEEQLVALHAYAVEQMPNWMERYAARHLRGQHKMLLAQLRQIKTSQPNHPKVHFGAGRLRQRLRSTSKT